MGPRRGGGEEGGSTPTQIVSVLCSTFDHSNRHDGTPKWQLELSLSCVGKSVYQFFFMDNNNAFMRCLLRAGH